MNRVFYNLSPTNILNISKEALIMNMFSQPKHVFYDHNTRTHHTHTYAHIHIYIYIYIYIYILFYHCIIILFLFVLRSYMYMYHILTEVLQSRCIDCMPPDVYIHTGEVYGEVMMALNNKNVNYF